MQLESSRTRGLLQHLKKRWGGSWVKIHGNQFQPRTIDILGCYRGLFIGLEVKRPTSKPTLRQLATINEIRKEGGIAEVVWSNQEVDQAVNKAIDKIIRSGYSGNIDITHTKGELPMPSKSRGAQARASKAQDEDLEEIEDLDEDDDEEVEVEDEDDEAEDEDEDEDEEDEDEEPAPKSKAKSKSKAKASATPSRRGNPGNLKPRTLPEGMVGASAIAEQVNADPAVVRRHLRKLQITTAEGVYQWKPGSKDFKDVVKKVQKSLSEASAAK